MDYTNCTLCPRQCGVDRTAGQLGFREHLVERLHVLLAPDRIAQAAAAAVPFSSADVRWAAATARIVPSAAGLWGKPWTAQGFVP